MYATYEENDNAGGGAGAGLDMDLAGRNGLWGLSRTTTTRRWSR